MFRAPARFDLRGARLAGWRFCGLPGRPLVLRDADFREADLQQVGVRARGPLGRRSLGSKAGLAEFHETTAAGLAVAAADLSGTLWRRSTLADANPGAAILDGSRFIRCRFFGVSWPGPGSPPLFAACEDEGGLRSTLAEGPERHLDTFTGHRGSVMACAVSPDGRGSSPARRTTRCGCGMRREGERVDAGGHGGRYWRAR